LDEAARTVAAVTRRVLERLFRCLRPPVEGVTTMFRRHLSGFGAWPFAALGGVCLIGADAGGGGGAPAGGAAVADAGEPGRGAEGDAGGGADAGADDAAAAAAAAGDEDGDFSGDDDEVIATLPEPTLRTRHRRAQRTLAKVRPLADRLRDPRTGQFMTPQELDTVLASHRDFRPIDDVLRRSPEAVQFLMRERQRLDALERGDAPAGNDPADAPFNDEEWEFETDTPQGRRLLAMAKTLHEQTRETRSLKRELQGVQTGFRKETNSRAEETWKTATLTAAREIEDANARRWFINNIGHTFRSLESNGRLQTVNVQQLIDSELNDLRVSKGKKTRGDITRQSAIVAGNGTLPKTPRPGTTTPANAGDSRKRETMADASKGFLARYAR
jgi:hypothetical protein